jgi:hypothetical protein
MRKNIKTFEDLTNKESNKRFVHLFESFNQQASINGANKLWNNWFKKNREKLAKPYLDSILNFLRTLKIKKSAATFDWQSMNPRNLKPIFKLKGRLGSLIKNPKKDVILWYYETETSPKRPIGFPIYIETTGEFISNISRWHDIFLQYESETDDKKIHLITNYFYEIANGRQPNNDIEIDTPLQDRPWMTEANVYDYFLELVVKFCKKEIK